MIEFTSRTSIPLIPLKRHREEDLVRELIRRGWKYSFKSFVSAGQVYYRKLEWGKDD